MPDRIISIFGTYDFLGKSLPGMTLVIGIVTLIPSDTFIIPDITESVIILLTIVFIVGLAGTLLGEFVHSLADIFEKIVGWILRWTWEILQRIVNWLFPQYNIPEADILANKVRGDQDDANRNIEDIEELDGLFRKFYIYLKKWGSNQVTKVAHVVWPHRKIFYKRIKVIEDESFRLDTPIENAGFAEEFFIKKVLVEDYGVRQPSDSDQIYPVVVTTLSEANYDRAFRFQSRCAFCRSMWLVLTLLSVAYFLTTVRIPEFVPPELLTSNSLIASLDPTVRFAISVLLLFTSVVFAFASGAYKKYYIDYIISEIYVHKKSSSSSSNSEEPYRRPL